MNKYLELDRLEKIKEQSQLCGDFLKWLQTKDELDLKGFTDSFRYRRVELMDKIKNYPCWLYYYSTRNEYEEEINSYICTFDYLKTTLNNIQKVLLNLSQEER